MGIFLFKTEPSTYSYADLVRDKRTVWDGVSNPVALRHLAGLRKGDTVVIYHTGAEKSAVGLARATTDPFPDPGLDDPRRLVTEIAAGRRLPRAVTLARIKQDAVLGVTPLARAPRLSIVPFTEAQFRRLLELAGVDDEG